MRIAYCVLRIAYWLMAATLIGAIVNGCHNAQGKPTSANPNQPQPTHSRSHDWFVDATKQVGITFVHYNGKKDLATAMEEAGPGCSFCDYDKDGWLDVYIVNGRDLYGRGVKSRNVLYRNNRNGTFTDVTEKADVPGTGYGMGCVWGDYDNDGDADLYVTQWGKNVLYCNNADGTFADVTDKAGVGAMEFGEPFHGAAAFGDYDKDGWLDLYVGCYLKFRLDGLRYCMMEGRVKTSCPPQSYDGTPSILYHNNGDGTFTNVTKQAGVYKPNGKALSAIFSDYDEDGYPDLFVSNDGIEAYLFRNQRNGTFRNDAATAGIAFAAEGANMAAMGTDLGDYDNDGRLDLFIADFQNAPNHLWHNEGKGFFLDVTVPSGIGEPSYNYLGFGAGFMDYDNDGWLDIFVANGHVYPGVDELGTGETYKQINQLFRNLSGSGSDGTFAEATKQAGSGFLVKAASRGAAFGDYDNDGDVDVLVANNDDPPTLLRNNVGNRQRFLSLQLVNAHGSDAIGAKVRVTAGNLRQVREARTGGSFFSHSDTRLHFGLGANSRVDKIEVKWANGRAQTFSAISADSFYRIVEGQTSMTPASR